MSSSVLITAFYAFLPLDQSSVDELQTRLKTFGQTHGMRGLVLIASEGINGTVCGSPSVIQEWKDLITAQFPGIIFKDSRADHLVFSRWSVKIKPEIVNLKQPDVRPSGPHKHLSPEEWEKILNEEDVLVLDARNHFEYAIGKFKGALDCNTESFSEFPDYVKNAGLPKEKKILMYCTGGIRCEKALIEMEKQGYENVYQLDGGILGYLAKFPDSKFEGECFVFDHRASVDQHLRPSQKYRLCPHCGDPGDVRIHCAECETECIVCESCAEIPKRKTCSKQCAYVQMKQSRSPASA